MLLLNDHRTAIETSAKFINKLINDDLPNK